MANALQEIKENYYKFLRGKKEVWITNDKETNRKKHPFHCLHISKKGLNFKEKLSNTVRCIEFDFDSPNISHVEKENLYNILLVVAESMKKNTSTMVFEAN